MYCKCRTDNLFCKEIFERKVIETEHLTKNSNQTDLTFQEFKKTVLTDYQQAVESREVSIQGRRIVLTGKAKFGIFGAGKEVAQIAMAKAFQLGDWRSGYYRDQTFAFAKKIVTYQQYFAQLYSDPRKEKDPHSMGRQMNAHFANTMVDENGNFLSQTDQYNTAADLAPTASQMPRSVGLALASKLYKSNPLLKNWTEFSKQGNEVCFATIGDASCAEGLFWESLNAAAVQQIPLCISVWDDGYGISVPAEYQIAKSDISELISGFKGESYEAQGIDIYIGYGWDYSGLVNLYKVAVDKIRKTQRPALIHVKEITQPQGHSTSGSHERYKDTQRLDWEKKNDCNLKFKNWILDNNIADEEELHQIEQDAKALIKHVSTLAYKEYLEPIIEQQTQLVACIEEIADTSSYKAALLQEAAQLKQVKDPARKDIIVTSNKILRTIRNEQASSAKAALIGWKDELLAMHKRTYNSFLYNKKATSALNVPVIEPIYSNEPEQLNGYQILNRFFDISFSKHENLVAFGEDVGKIGGVNQSMTGLQKKYGEHRVFDTGIREATIIGQAIGLSMRGIKPIAEIQYLDYLLYGLQTLSDDLASLHYRSAGVQFAPAIIRTRGHRLEGIWHTGSPIGVVLNALRGIHVCVPRNMVQAAGMYNTLLQSNDPGLVIERLNAYRLKEALPENLGAYTVPLGVPEILHPGEDITLVSYGSTLPIAEQAAMQLKEVGISVELIDIRTLLPFDIHKIILQSVKKTNRLVLVDEDVPGGATGYMLQQLLDEQQVYWHLDSPPVTIPAKAHRPPFGSDGDYFAKPNTEQIFEVLYEMMNEAEPLQYPIFY